MRRLKNLKAVDNKEHREQVFVKLEKELKDMVKEKESNVEESSPPKTMKRNLGIEFEESSDEEGEEFDEITKEMENYRHKALQDCDEDPLDWWRQRKAKYPHLVKIVG